MKRLVTAGLGLAVAACASTQASAQTYVFNHTGVIVDWTVPTTATYFIEAIGAQGGRGTMGGGSFVGGRGALIGGKFDLFAGSVLRLAVGGAGSSYASNYNGGGGGGSFVVDWFGNAMLVAGGGGGIRAYAAQNGSDASITEYAKQGSGGNSSYPDITKTTGLGQGGVVSSGSWGGGGAGFFSDGAVDFMGSGKSWANGLAGGDGTAYSYEPCRSLGGFGGGGSGTGCGGGGGGGGYSGGDGGWIAGGGGSYNAGYDQVAVAGVGYGDGLITITALDAPVVTPEPVSMALLGTGLAGLGAARRRSRKRETEVA